MSEVPSISSFDPQHSSSIIICMRSLLQACCRQRLGADSLAASDEFLNAERNANVKADNFGIDMLPGMLRGPALSCMIQRPTTGRIASASNHPPAPVRRLRLLL